MDFSGSVNQDLVYTFLGRVIDLCQELSYTDVVVPPEPSFDTVDGIAGVRALASDTEARLHWTDAMNARVLSTCRAG